MSARPVGRQGPGAQVQQLHLVGLTTDLDSLICSARKGAKSGSFVLPLNEHLLLVIAEAVTRRNADGIEIEVPDALKPAPATPRRQSHLSPREIQDRLRAGRSLEEIASEAGVGEEWVGRFAAPVEAERSQVVGRARRLTFYRPRRGDSGEPLGMSVRWNLADKGVRLANDEFDAAWSAYQLAEQAWMVTFSFESRKRMHEAEWEVDLATNELLSRNRMATELGYVEPGRRRRSTASLQPMARASATQPAPIEAVSEEAPAAPKRASPVPAKKKKKKKNAPSRKAAPARKAPARRTPAATTGRGRKPAPAKKASSRRPSAGKRTAGRASAATRKAAPARARTSSAGRRTPTVRKAASPRKPPSPRKAGSQARRAPAKKAAVKKAAGRTATRRTGRGVPPVSSAVPSAPVDDRPAPNELGRRRLQLVSGIAPPRPPVRSRSPMGERANPGVRIAASRSGDVAPPQPSTPAENVAPEPGLDVGDSGSAAEARRAERRRARAAAREATPASDDGRMVAIRANRATPPRGDAEVIVPADLPPLRPAQPATQPRKRLFNRNGR